MWLVVKSLMISIDNVSVVIATVSKRRSQTGIRCVAEWIAISSRYCTIDSYFKELRENSSMTEIHECPNRWNLESTRAEGDYDGRYGKDTILLVKCNHQCLRWYSVRRTTTSQAGSTERLWYRVSDCQSLSYDELITPRSSKSEQCTVSMRML